MKDAGRRISHEILRTKLSRGKVSLRLGYQGQTREPQGQMLAVPIPILAV